MQEMSREDDACRVTMQLPPPVLEKISTKPDVVVGLAEARRGGELREKFIRNITEADGRPERVARAEFDVSGTMESFKVKRVLGTGMTGNVLLASCPGMGDNKMFALKKVKKVTHELLSACRCHNIIRMSDNMKLLEPSRTVFAIVSSFRTYEYKICFRNNTGVAPPQELHQKSSKG